MAFFIQGVLEQATEAVSRAARLLALQAEWRQMLLNRSATALTQRLADALFVDPVLTIPAAQKLLGVQYPSARRSIDKLIEAGILRQVDATTTVKVFTAERILQIVTSEPTKGEPPFALEATTTSS